MLKLLKSDKLEFPLTSEKNKTYVSPILERNCYDKNFYKLAQGWRYFRYLNVIQKISDKLFIKVMSLEQFLLQAKKSSFNCKKFSELIVHNLTKKRDCNIDLDFSKPNLMGVINITPDSFYKKSRVSDIKKFNSQFNKLFIIIVTGGMSVDDHNMYNYVDMLEETLLDPNMMYPSHFERREGYPQQAQQQPQSQQQPQQGSRLHVAESKSALGDEPGSPEGAPPSTGEEK